MNSQIIIKNCPFCDGEECCFCDWTGKVRIGPGQIFESEEAAKPFYKEAPLESDLRDLYDRGGLNHVKGRSNGSND